MALSNSTPSHCISSALSSLRSMSFHQLPLVYEPDEWCIHRIKWKKRTPCGLRSNEIKIWAPFGMTMECEWRCHTLPFSWCALFALFAHSANAFERTSLGWTWKRQHMHSRSHPSVSSRASQWQRPTTVKIINKLFIYFFVALRLRLDWVNDKTVLLIFPLW